MTSTPKILVVDDNPLNLEICHEILDGRFEVLAASNGTAAIQIACESNPQIVLLDAMMPEMDGYETCRRIRRLPGMRNARIVMVSAKALSRERAQGIEAGADEYLTKPFDEAELITAIESS